MSLREGLFVDEGIARVFEKRPTGKKLDAKILGAKLYVYDEVTSTNDLAHRFAHEGAPQGTLVVAKGQTQGRGRYLGRS
jgi:hypothetical protein